MNPEESFIDEATISVRAGDGGDGCVAMRREKFVPRGGPSGGDGGRGGNVVITADRNLSTLCDQRMRRKIRAESGQKGGVSNRTGRGGRELEIRVPVGTVVYDLEAENEVDRLIWDGLEGVTVVHDVLDVGCIRETGLTGLDASFHHVDDDEVISLVFEEVGPAPVSGC